ncbi:MAG: hypothetical protein K9G41_02230 [Flavobacteriales bacterium]|nr:hypothetical protein [Flavobacteriales bacterium]
MKRLITSILTIVFLGQCVAFSQEQSDTLLAKDNVMFELPTISINFGVNHLLGDVSLNKPASTPVTQFGYQLTITQSVTKFLNASLSLYTGNVRGEQMRDSITNVNFRTTLFSQQLSVEYNFYPLLKPKDDGRQLIRPFVGFGVGLLSFRSKGDLKNSSGVAYNYWSDGTVRAEAEGSINPSESTLLERDFEYETDLRDANLDGLRKYSQLAFSLPINGGVRFQVSKNVGVNAAFTYALNFTDLIDNVSSESVGSRQGKKGFDNQIYGSVGLSVFLGRTKHSSKPKRFDNLMAEEAKPASKERSEVEFKNELASLTDEPTTADVTSVPSDSSVVQNAPIPTQSVFDIKLAEVLAKKMEINQLKASIDQQLRQIDIIKQEIGNNSKIKKAQIQQVKGELQTANSTISGVESFIAANHEENTNAEPVKTKVKSKVDANKEISSKEVALSTLAQLSKELKYSLTEIRKEEKELAKVEYKLNAFNVIRAKIRLMEKMNSKDGINSSMSEVDKIKTMDAALAELKTLEQDSSYDKLIDRSEIEQLATRVEALKVPAIVTEQKIASSNSKSNEPKNAVIKDDSSTATLDSANKIESERSKSSESKNGQSTSSKNASSSKPASETDQKGRRSVEDIKNAPPKASGGFHWADVNKNGMISPDEVLYFIDALFEGDSEKNVEDIQNLIDYYFDQE